MSTEDSDKMKAEMRKVIMEHFGGEEIFKAIAFYIRKNIQERVVGNLESVKKDLEEEKTEEGQAKD